MSEEELQKALCSLEESQAGLRTLFLGLAMEYRAMEGQKALLLGCPRPGEPDPKNIQIGASLIILCALLGFYKLAKENTEASETPAQQNYAGVEVTLNLVMIVIALIRLTRLACPPSLEPQPQETALIDSGEDVI